MIVPSFHLPLNSTLDFQIGHLLLAFLPFCQLFELGLDNPKLLTLLEAGFYLSLLDLVLLKTVADNKLVE